MNRKNQKSFTLVELLAVIMIIAAVAGFAIPNYSRSVERAHEQDGLTQLRAIHAANQIFNARTNSYWPADAGAYTVNDINTNLGLNIIESGMAYACSGTDGTTFDCTATRAGGSFTLTVDENPLSAANPSCTGGDCP